MALFYFCSLFVLSLTVGYSTMAHHISGVKVIPPDASPPPVSAPSPTPTPGGELSSSPSRGWGSVSGADPSPAPDNFPLVPKERTHSRRSTGPSGAPEGGDGIPFISSNPSVPLPTGVTDTATIHPLPTPGGDRNDQVVGLGSVARVQRALLASVTMFVAALVLWIL